MGNVAAARMRVHLQQAGLSDTELAIGPSTNKIVTLGVEVIEAR